MWQPTQTEAACGLTQASRQATRIAEVEQDAFQRLDRERDGWIVVTLVPDSPGDLSITTASFNYEFRQKTIQTGPALIVPAQISLDRVKVGRRRSAVLVACSASPRLWPGRSRAQAAMTIPVGR